VRGITILVATIAAVSPAVVRAGDSAAAPVVALAHTGDIGAAVRDAEKHLRGVDRATALARIVEAQLEHGDIAGALSTAGKISTWGWAKTPKARALGAIATAQAAAGDSAGSRRTFENARRVARRLPASDIKGNSPQASVLESIARTEARVGDLEGALRTLDSIDRAYFKVGSLVAVAKAQVEAGDRAGAERLLDRAAETARGVRDQDSAASVLAQVATAYARFGNVAAAHAAANAIRVTRESVYVKVVALASLAVAYHSSGLIEQADNVLTEAARLTEGMEKSDNRKAWARTTVADAQARISSGDSPQSEPGR
jgi:tetratricopeptide (TPR) repeat protein